MFAVCGAHFDRRGADGGRRARRAGGEARRAGHRQWRIHGCFPTLANPKNDAEDMAAALKALGFTVIFGIDLDKRGMDREDPGV